MLRPSIRELLRAFEVKDPPPDRQKAVTSTLLRDMLELSQGWTTIERHAAELIVGAFFFAMRACEFCETRKAGRTIPITTGNVTFRDKWHVLLDQNDPEISQKAKFVSVCFVDQKNGRKMDRRTQQKTGGSLCPVTSWAKVCRRVRRWGGNDMTNVFELPNRQEEERVDAQLVTTLLRRTCILMQGKRAYGIEPREIGTRSIRSGAAMALFMKGHSVERIKILGRWSSDAFMVYIRPQVLEWTNVMSRDMARSRGFMDLYERGNQNARRDDGEAEAGLMPSFGPHRR